MGIILAILLFSAIVIFHELGHFLLAKKNKIRVDDSLWVLDRLFLENSLEKQNSA